MMKDSRCDLLIVGAGSAGLTAARFGARVGATVILVDRRPPGGDCLYTGCVPSKALLKAARVAHEMRSAARWGLPATDPNVDLGVVMDRVRTAIDAVFVRDSPEALASAGVRFVRGAASFVGPREIEVLVNEDARHRVCAERVLIATGARPRKPSIVGIEDVPYETYETIFERRVLPRRLLVIGNGPIGVELAQAFSRLGSRVTLFCPADVAVARVNPELSKILGEAFREEGIDVRLRARITHVRRRDDGVILATDARGDETEGDVLLVATGRAPELTGLALDRAGITTSSSSSPAIVVDDYLRTSAPDVFACGDCTGGPQYTHHAGFQGFVAARNALFPGASRGVRESPWTIFTEPELAHVGLDAVSARRAYGEDVEVTRLPLSHVDRAQAEHATRGLFELVHTRAGRVLGASIAADRAGELAAEVALAIQKRASVADIASATHIYPTYAMGLQELALEAATTRLLSGVRGKIVRAFAFRTEEPGPARKRWLFTVMGVVFLAQGIGKTLDVAGYVAALSAFRMIPASSLSTVGALWIAAELASGTLLMVAGTLPSPPRSFARFGAVMALCVSLGYAVLDVQGYARGLAVANCTCFGVYLAQRLSWFVLVQEAYVLVLLMTLLRKATRWRSDALPRAQVGA